MNLHFRPPPPEGRFEEERVYPPRQGYGLIDQVELDAERDVVVYWIDIIDRKWLEAKGERDHRFSLRDVDETSRAWSDFHAKGTDSSMTDPYKEAPLFRLEVHVKHDDPLGAAMKLLRPQGPEDVEGISAIERQWVEVEIDPQSAQPSALSYSGLFVTPIVVEVRGKLPNKKVSEVLSRIFSLKNLPTISTADLALFIEKHAQAEQLAVYDVGQGNANALLGADVYPPSIYFDLGAGVYMNRPTRPATMRFCFSRNQPVILSHWDMDHWAGACAAHYPADRSPIDSTWIVPLQDVTPVHAAFAYGIATGGGKVLVYAPMDATDVGTAVLDPVTQIRFGRGTGPDKNSSGIVLVVERQISPTDCRSWLLTGDCDYGYFLPHMTPAAPVAALVPHHGATAHTATPPPTPVSGYRRLAYSFGPRNKHGRTKVQHPTERAVEAHQNAGWLQINWPAAPYGNQLPGADTRATGEHASGTARGGVLIGWTAAPSLPATLCPPTQCDTVLNQS